MNAPQVSIYAGGLFIKLALGWDMYISIAGLLLVTGLYTVIGSFFVSCVFYFIFYSIVELNKF